MDVNMDSHGIVLEHVRRMKESELFFNNKYNTKSDTSQNPLEKIQIAEKIYIYYVAIQ